MHRIRPIDPLILAFWDRLDNMTEAEWLKCAERAQSIAWTGCRSILAAIAHSPNRQGEEGEEEERDASHWAYDAGRSVALVACRWTARGISIAPAVAAAATATNEIRAMRVLEGRGREPYFLRLFGLRTWDEVRAMAVREMVVGRTDGERMDCRA